MPAETRQAVPSAPVAQTPAAPTKVEAVAKAPQISAEEMGLEAASRKDATTSQLHDMNERLQVAIETLNVN